MYSIQFITKIEKMDAQKTKAIQIISCITVLHILIYADIRASKHSSTHLTSTQNLPPSTIYSIRQIVDITFATNIYNTKIVPYLTFGVSSPKTDCSVLRPFILAQCASPM